MAFEFLSVAWTRAGRPSRRSQLEIDHFASRGDGRGLPCTPPRWRPKSERSQDRTRRWFHEVHWGLHGPEIQSLKQAKEAYQDDHFFIVTDNELVRRVSDHGPVVLELDVSAG